MGKPLLGNDVIIQIGILVNDIETTSKEYAKFFGTDVPAIVMTGEAKDAKTEYMGKPTEGRCKQSFFDIGNNLQLELLEPDAEPSVWRDCLNSGGEGFHHIAFRINGMQDTVELCGREGIKLLQKGQWDTGRYAYMDSTDKLKMMIELLEFDN